MTKPTKWHVRPAKTQISLGIHPVWSESSLSAWRKLGSLATHWVHSEDSDQTGWMPRLIWVLAGCTVILLVLSRGGSIMLKPHRPNFRIMAAPVAEWLRPLIFSTLNRSSSRCCAFEPSLGYMWDKPSSACGWSDVFSRGSPVFAPPYDWHKSEKKTIFLG